MLEISLRQLETFVVTAECASFTRAADKLHLSESGCMVLHRSQHAYTKPGAGAGQPAYTARRT